MPQKEHCYIKQSKKKREKTVRWKRRASEKNEEKEEFPFAEKMNEK